MQRLPVGHTSHLIKHERDDVVLVKENPGEIKNKNKANFGLARRDLFLMLNDERIVKILNVNRRMTKRTVDGKPISIYILHT